MRVIDAEMRVDKELLSEIVEIYGKHRGQLALEQTVEVTEIEMEDEGLLITIKINSPWLH